MRNSLVYNLTGYLLGWGICVLQACSSPPHKQVSPSDTLKKPSPEKYRKPASSYSDTIFITGISAIFFQPDPVQKEKIRQTLDSMVFDSNEHDCIFQPRYSRKYILENWPAVRVLETLQNRYIHFLKKDGQVRVIDLNANNDMCGLYLFDGIQDPVVADMTNVETSLSQYFNK